MTAPPRFTDDELVEIVTATQMRSPVIRDTGDDCERIDIVIPHLSRCRYRVERDMTGCTYLLFISPDEVKLLASGTLVECLNVFRLPSDGNSQ